MTPHALICVYTCLFISYHSLACSFTFISANFIDGPQTQEISPYLRIYLFHLLMKPWHGFYLHIIQDSEQIILHRVSWPPYKKLPTPTFLSNIMWFNPISRNHASLKIIYVSVQFPHAVVSDSLQPHGLQHPSPLCPSPTLRVYSHSRPLSQW